MFAANAAVYAIQNATTEGKATVVALLILSLFSWTIIITKFRQLVIARKATKKFLAAYSSTRDPLDIQRKGEEFDGAPAYQLYIRGADELAYQLKNNPVTVKGERRISTASFEAVKVALEEAASGEAMALEKGMIVLSTAVAGGPFIGLLGTVWGVMSTFAGIAESRAATLTAMAPGVLPLWWPQSPACSWPSRPCSPTTSWSPPSAPSPRSWMVTPRVTRRKSCTAMWITAIWKTRSRWR